LVLELEPLSERWQVAVKALRLVPLLAARPGFAYERHNKNEERRDH
jgi:hypothetical protein